MAMVSQFHLNHIINFLQNFDLNPTIPLDAQLSFYLKQNKAIGSKDRKIVGDVIYDVIRLKSLLDGNLNSTSDWESRVSLYLEKSINELLKNPNLKREEKVSFPKPFYDTLLSHFDQKHVDQICSNLNLPAPITIRVNVLKISRDELFKSFSSRFSVSLTKDCLTGITFHKKINFFELPEFKKGYFEIQDEASQLVAEYVDAKAGDEVLDFCAGAGGKSLSIATKMKGKGQLFLFDIREKALMQAKIRFKRAGIQNFQIVKQLNPKLKNRMNWILLDVPCTGSGTWRRNPDQKWKFSHDVLKKVIEEQRKIFESALPYLHPKGKIVYSTCSILPEENEEQISYFMETYNLLSTKPFFKSVPKQDGKDGFFAAVLEKSSLV